jgi:hypothetical protein
MLPTWRCAKIQLFDYTFFGIIRLRSGRRHRRGCRELDRLEMLLWQIKAVEAERDALLTPASFGL